MSRHWLPCIAAVAAGLLLASADPVRAGGNPDSVFHINRPQARSEVHYGVTLDSHCHPTGASPIYNYWLHPEETPPRRSPVKLYQQVAYGFQSETVGADGSVEARLRALPERLLTIRTRPETGGCKAEAFLMIAGHEASLDRVFVVADPGTFLPTVRYIELFGHGGDGAAVYEKLQIAK